jgi:exportin-5
LAEDPILKQRIIKLVVDISSRALDKTPSFALKVLEHILMTHVDDHPEYPAFSDAVRELQSLSSHELRRLSMRYADYFFVGVRKPLVLVRKLTKSFQTFYDVLEPKIKEITASHSTDDKLQTELTSVLLIIT